MPILVIASLVFAGQLANKTSVYFALLTTSAVVFGLLSVSEAGGLKSVIGFFNALLTTKTLLIAIALKSFTLQPSDSGLAAPNSTAAVMALGFLGLLIGTWLFHRLPVPKAPFIPGVSGARMYLALTIVVGLLSYGGFFFGMAPDYAGAGIQTGGLLGIARSVSMFRTLPIVTALYFAWARGGKRFLTHPLVLTVLLISMVFGVISTAKLDAMEPLLFYVAIGVSRYGYQDKRLWSLAVAGVAYYSLIIYPYSQYVRDSGGREGDLQTRVKVMGNVLWWQLTDPNFREYLKTQTDSKTEVYLGKEYLEPFSRLAMIGEADRLVLGTNEKSTTGWETINWGFSLVSPSFLFPDKQIVGAGNYLAHVSGDADPSDSLTQFSYGVMANFYNAFSYKGVIVGSFVFFAFFYYFLRLWFGNPVWVSSPSGTALWFLMLVGYYQHPLVEESISGMMSDMSMPFVLLVLYQIAKYLTRILPEFDDNNKEQQAAREAAIRSAVFLPRPALNQVQMWSLATGNKTNPSNDSSQP